MALALSKQGHFEWEDFRQNLISSIAAWEQDACDGQAKWDYYERYTLALIAMLEQCGVLKPGELERQIDPRRSKQVNRRNIPLLRCLAHSSVQESDVQFPGLRSVTNSLMDSS